MTTKEYYIAPPIEVFEDIKKCSIEIWKTYDDTYGYATEKIDSIKDLENIKDNAWSIVGRFDFRNQGRLVEKVQPLTKTYLMKIIEW